MMAFLVWSLLAATAVYWLIQLVARPLLAPAYAQTVVEQGSGTADLTRLLGAAPPVQLEAAPVAESRFSLLGVVAPKSLQASQAGEGLALIAVDGVPRTVRIGAVLDGDLQLLSVHGNSAQLGQAGVVRMNLSLAPPLAPTTGSLPPAQASTTVLGGQPALPGSLPVRPMPPGQESSPQQLYPQANSVDANGLPTR